MVATNRADDSALAIIPSQFDGCEVRVVTDDQDEPWFPANPVCRILGYGNPHQALATHVDADDLHKLEAIDSIGRTQRANHINESGLYALILGSSKPEARRFKRWITHDVLLAIRKTGRYAAPSVSSTMIVSTIPQTFPEALRLAADLAEVNGRLERAIECQTKKVAALDRLAAADGSLNVTAAAKSLKVKPTCLFDWLSREQWIYRRGGGRWAAYQVAIMRGVLEHRTTTIQREDGTDKAVDQVLITPKGLAELARKIPAGAARGGAQ